MTNILKAGRPSENQNKLRNQLTEQDAIIKMNISIKKSFHKQVKRYALENDMTVTELIHKALQEYMKV